MSRIGIKPVEILKDVQINIRDGIVFIEGPKGKLQFQFPVGISCEQKDGKIHVVRADDLNKTRALHGTSRALVFNMVLGVTKGFDKVLMLEGVGYKALVQGKTLKLNVGFTHSVEYAIPEGIKIDVVKQVEIAISGVDKALVGQVAAEIRHICPPEPYKGKGIRYKDERIRRKVGKSVTK